jgi:hypothetical protein
VVPVVQSLKRGEQRLYFFRFVDEAGLRLLRGGELAHGTVVRGVLVEVLEHADGNIQQSARVLHSWQQHCGSRLQRGNGGLRGSGR